MIDWVKGRVVYVESDYVVVDVHGVGYQVFVPNPFRFKNEEIIELFTHLIVREDAHLLYGFSNKDERDFFRLLLEVSGIGPKAGLAMIASGDLRQVIMAIQTEDVKFLTRLPGIGKKTAARIVLDLKDKLKKMGWESRLGLLSSVSPSDVSVGSFDDQQDVIDALLGLGYTEEEAKQFAEEAKASASESLSTEEWIRRALQISMKR
ncbi:Holliday junction branch migration protein RuvA [Thermoflavimicrobium dichotomicum]|uniref:Holliday junction branch migration complex subunit RuvA n=1 Tax=Thermoflavimicrobium dichotomicum TaxID=46223 RepID=A0A1I3R505_9BACL|nr:Holliday junction branch migration protein RuvA [Thermoflavimicrobium dichotomicum]SFJ41185.1 holliday junction DNA helicase RuvA [Thermoflavimicrobium dichotomicum]